MIRLVIADDHPVVREGLKHVLARCRDIEVIGQAQDAESAISVCRAVNPDVLLLDVTMPGPGIIDVITDLKESQPELRILVLSVHPERHYARRVFHAGADGYLTKNHSSEALASAVRHVHSGNKYVGPSLLQELALELAQGRQHEAHDTLSNREHEIFLQLGTGKSIAEVALQLNLSPKTVRTYRSRILEKLSVSSTAELIFYAVEHGLVGEVMAQPGERPSARSRRTNAR